MKTIHTKTNYLFSSLLIVLLVLIYGGSKLLSNHLNPKVISNASTQIDAWLEKQNNMKELLDKNYQGLIKLLDSKKLPEEFFETEGKAAAIPVLLYHGIIDSNDTSEGITKELFIDHMYALKSQGWSTVTLEDFYMFIRGEKTLPYKSFLLT